VSASAPSGPVGGETAEVYSESISIPLFARAWVGLLAVDLSLRVLGYRRTRGLLRGRSDSTARDPGRAIARVSRAVDAATRRHVYRMTCLRRSLVMQHELRRAGVETELLLGVRRSGESLEAHAWLEVDGTPVREREDPRAQYEPLGRDTR